ncbi:Melanoma-Associated Antigen 10 [Manis pentadactyla]|nr:Melanoma-Associated Antigen 10 [Manis pentadactyla]
MPRRPTKQRRYMPEEGLPTLTETQGLVGAQDPGATEEVASSSSSRSSASATSSSSPSSSSCFAHISSEARSFPSVVINAKTAQLVAFLLLKYLAVESTTRAELLEVLGQDHQDQFPVIYSCVSECLQLVFGIDVKEVDPSDHSYILVTALGLTGRQLSNEQSLPKTGLLVLLLIMIFMRGGRVPAEDVWEMLGVMGICPGREHFVFGDPTELITRAWVQDQYLEYQQVPNSDPTHLELLWGARAHAEIDVMKVLGFMAKVKDSTANACLPLYEEAVRDQEGPGQASIAAVDDAATVAGASSSGMSPGFCPE